MVLFHYTTGFHLFKLLVPTSYFYLLFVAQQKYKCSVALFSLTSFNVQGKVLFLDWTKDYCHEDNERCLYNENSSSSIAIALRGNCSFDMKANTAFKMGYKVHICLSSS